MSHFKLDELTAELAEKAGAKIILKHTVQSFPSGFDNIIGCDGANSFIRRNLGLPNPVYRLAIQGFVKKKDNSDFVETWPVNQGFIWKIPRGKETEYGVMSNQQEAKLLLDEFLKKNKIQLERIESALVPQGLVIPFHPSITLCGDALGLCKPWSGGGVIWGLIAAEILLKNFPDCLKYKNAVRRNFLPKIMFSKIAVKAVYFLGYKMPWLLPKNIKIEGDFLL